MVNPQPTDAHIRIAHSIEEEIMMRDFTKRQRSILDLILRLSWGCGKKTAIIPLQKDFTLVGIDQTKVKSELNWLVNAKVITWNQDEKEFAFNKNYDEWRVSIVIGYDRKRFNELLNLNLKTCQNGKLELDEKASQGMGKLAETSSDNNDRLDEKARNDLTKKQVSCAPNTDKSMPEGVSKESIKENTTTITTDTTNSLASTEQISGRLPGASDEIYRELENHYFKLTGRLANPKDCIAMTDVLDRPLAVPLDYKSRLEIIKTTMDRMTERKKISNDSKIKSFKFYIDGILEEYKKLEITQMRGEKNGHSANQGESTRNYGNGVIDYNQGFNN